MQVIRSLDFFEPLAETIIKEIARQCSDRQFAPGDSIVRQGEPGLGLYFICSGRVRVETDHEAAAVTPAELTTGACVGELSIVDDKSNSTSVVCTESTTCLLLTRDSLSRLMNKHPQIALQMIKAFAERLRAAKHRIVESAEIPEPTPSGQTLSEQTIPESGTTSSTSFLPLRITTPAELVESYTETKGK